MYPETTSINYFQLSIYFVSHVIIVGREACWTRIILFREKEEGSYRLYQELPIEVSQFFWILIIRVISNLILNIKILIELFYMKISSNLCFVGVYYIIKRTTISLTWKYYFTFLV